MAIRWIEKVTGSIEYKKRYRKYKARTEQLPANYRTAIDALNRYLMYFGGITKGDTLVAMLEDLADLFEQSAANEPRSARSSGRTLWSLSRRFSRTTRRVSGSTRSGNG